MATQKIHEQGSIAQLRKHVPLRKMSARYTTKPPSHLPEFEMIKPPSQTSVKATVIESEVDSSPSIDPENDTVMESDSSDTKRLRPQPPPLLTIPRKAHVAPPQAEPVIIVMPSVPTQETAKLSSTTDEYAKQFTTTAATADTPNDEPTSVVTPAMRSMFPTYNPNIPLSQQQYRPANDDVPVVIRSPPLASLGSNNPYRRQAERIERSCATPEPAIIDVRETPLRRSESLKRSAAVATADQLSTLWDIANGQAYANAADSYVLELSW